MTGPNTRSMPPVPRRWIRNSPVRIAIAISMTHGFEHWRGHAEPFDCAQHRDRWCDHPVAVEEGGARRSRARSARWLRDRSWSAPERGQRQDPTLASIVGPHHQGQVLHRDHDDQRPDSQRRRADRPNRDWRRGRAPRTLPGTSKSGLVPMSPKTIPRDPSANSTVPRRALTSASVSTSCTTAHVRTGIASRSRCTSAVRWLADVGSSTAAGRARTCRRRSNSRADVALLVSRPVRRSSVQNTVGGCRSRGGRVALTRWPTPTVSCPPDPCRGGGGPWPDRSVGRSAANRSTATPVRSEARRRVFGRPSRHRDHSPRSR